MFNLRNLKKKVSKGQLTLQTPITVSAIFIVSKSVYEQEHLNK